MKLDIFTVIRILIIAVGIILLLWFALPYCVTRNVNIGMLTGMGIGIALTVYGIWEGQINRLIAAGWHTVIGKIIEIALLAVCAVIIGLAAACSAAMISASASTAEPGATVIVLGARIYDGKVSTSLSYRLDAAYDYLLDNPTSVCIVSGGQGDNEICTEASVMYEYLLEKGIDKERIYIEDKSTDTEENIAYCKQIIEDNDLNPTAAIVTSDYHEYRALTYAKRAGITADAVPALTQWWIFPTSIVREMYGILEQWLLK